MPTNPIQERINGGMSPIAAFLTEATCSEACWYAREEICRCSCGGKNHGCMRTADGVRPNRTARIDGYRYELKAVGPNLRSAATEINKAAGPRSIDRFTAKGYNEQGQLVDVPREYKYWWSETDHGAPARLRSASKDQIARWPELADFKEKMAAAQAANQAPIVYLREWPYLLWVKIKQQSKEAA